MLKFPENIFETETKSWLPDTIVHVAAVLTLAKGLLAEIVHEREPDTTFIC